MVKGRLKSFIKIAFIITAAAICLSCAACFTPAGFTELRVSSSRITILAGHGLKLTTNSKGSVTWVSLDEEIAEVDDFGMVSGKKVGETTVIALEGSLQAECAVTVVDDPETAKDSLTLVWRDEFDGASLDMDKWSYQTGTHDVYGSSNGTANWGNSELQSYQEDNVRLEGGNLIITAKREREKVDGKSFTSGRITSRGKFTTLYGYVEARMRLPAVSGMWPAFWMLPQPSSTDKTGNVYGGWARNGELDIMEARGRLPDEIDTTLHFGDNWPQNTHKGNKTYLSTPISEWHTYAVDWRKEYIAWIVDGKETFRLTYKQWWTAAVSQEENPYAPYDQPFYILFNLAVGGTYDKQGNDEIKANTDFVSASMSVDYVRVYSHNDK